MKLLPTILGKTQVSENMMKQFNRRWSWLDLASDLSGQVLSNQLLIVLVINYVLVVSVSVRQMADHKCSLSLTLEFLNDIFHLRRFFISASLLLPTRGGGQLFQIYESNLQSPQRMP